MADLGEIKGRITLDTSDLEQGVDKAKGEMNELGTASDEVATKTKASGQAYLDAAQSATTLAMSAYVLYDSYDGVQQAQTAAKAAANELAQAQLTAEQKQKALNDAIAKYGADSPEATRAADELAVAQDKVAVATDRAEMAAGNCDDAWVQFALGGITSVLGLVSGGAGLIKSLQGLPSVMGLVGNASKLLSGAFSFLAANPLVLVLMAIAAVALLIITNWDAVRPFFEALWNAISGIFQAAFDFIKPLVDIVWNGIKWVIEGVMIIIKAIIDTYWNGIKTIIEVVLGVIKAIIDAVWGGIKASIEFVMGLIRAIIEFVWQGIQMYINTVMGIIKFLIVDPITWVYNTVKGILEGLYNVFKTIFDTIKNTVKSAIDFIMGLIQPIIDLVNGLADAVGSLVPEGDVIPGLHLFGEGGHVTRPTLSVTGEKEGEWMIPDSKLPGFVSAMVSNSQEYVGVGRVPAVSGPLGSSTKSAVFNINGAQDPRAIMRDVHRYAKTIGLV